MSGSTFLRSGAAVAVSGVEPCTFVSGSPFGDFKARPPVGQPAAEVAETIAQIAFIDGEHRSDRGIAIPFSPLGQHSGFVPLPIAYFPWLAATLLSNCVLTQLVKGWYIRRYRIWL